MTGLEAGLRDLIAEVVRAELPEVVRKLVRDELREGPAAFLSTAEAASVARVSQKTIRRWIVAGKLVGHRSGHKFVVSRAELLRGMRPTATEPTDTEIDAMAARDVG